MEAITASNLGASEPPRPLLENPNSVDFSFKVPSLPASSMKSSLDSEGSNVVRMTPVVPINQQSSTRLPQNSMLDNLYNVDENIAQLVDKIQESLENSQDESEEDSDHPLPTDENNPKKDQATHSVANMNPPTESAKKKRGRPRKHPLPDVSKSNGLNDVNSVQIRPSKTSKQSANIINEKHYHFDTWWLRMVEQSVNLVLY
jgi:hypothetical protein